MRKIGNPQERIPDRAKQMKPLRGSVSEGMRFFWKNASLAPRRSGFDPRRLHLAQGRESAGADSRPRGQEAASRRCSSGLRSVNGKHTPFVRPGCGFESCRRLLSYARSSEDRVLPCDGSGRWFDSSRAYSRERSSSGRAPERHSGDARSTRAVRFRSKARGVTGSTASSNLAGPGSNPGGPVFLRSSRAGAARLSGEGGRTLVLRCGSTPRPDCTPRPRRHQAAAGRHGPVIDSSSTGRGFESRPEPFALR